MLDDKLRELVHTKCETCKDAKEGCCIMSQEQSKNDGGFCPAHFEIVKEVTTVSAEIKTLLKSHQQVYEAVERLRDDVRDRMPQRTVLLITVLSSGFVGLLCIIATHLLSK